MRGKNLFFFALGAGIVASGIWALSVGSLTSFSAGTPIKASEVNDNFTILRNAIVALEQPIGVNRLSIDGTIGDGKVLKAQGGNLVWGDDNTGGASFGASLSGTSAASPGFRVRNEAASAIGIRGEVNSTGSGILGTAGGGGIGVEGRSPGGLGVGVKGTIDGFGWGVQGVSNSTGIGVEGLATVAGGAGVSAKSNVATATALLVDGSIAVQGNKPAFVHTATAGNTSLFFTILDNPMTNSDPNAILIVTHLSNPLDPRINSPIAVAYDGARSRWIILRADEGTMPVGAKFNVLVIKQL